MGYIYTPFTSQIENCKVKILKGELHTEDDSVQSDNDEGQVLPLIESTCEDGWGRVKSHDFFSEVEFPLPKRLKLRYISKMESRCYDIDTLIDDKLAEELWKKQCEAFPEDPFCDVVVGTAPFGVISIWLQGKTRSVLLQRFLAEEAKLNEMEQAVYGWMCEPSGYESITRKELDEKIRQYNIRYVALEECWDEDTFSWVEFDREDLYYDNLDVVSIEDICSDGTFNFSEGDDEQFNYHKAGIPKRITVRWQEDDSECFAHFWFSNFLVSKIYNEFFEANPDVRTDFIIRLDAKNEMYQLALKREGESEVSIIPNYTYQLIVFCDDTELFRSSNYRLEPGQWSWW